MAFDNLCKLLSEKYPDRFAAWLLGTMPSSIKVLKTELSIEPIRADSVTFLATSDRILHLEFQVQLASNPPLPLRMLDYWVRLYRRYRLPVTPVVILLKPPLAGTVIETQFQVENTHHDYRVVQLWEESPDIFLQDMALLPLATLAKTNQPEQLLNQVAQQISKIESAEQRQEVSACAQVLAGLRFDKLIVQQLFRGEAMRESVIYQEILQEGWQEGLQEGLAQGKLRGMQEGEANLIWRMLKHRIGEVPAELEAQVKNLPLPQLEALGEALLDFSTLADLLNWLRSQPQVSEPD
jgi:predicted transposase/invertase (TIGR01784 family)